MCLHRLGFMRSQRRHWFLYIILKMFQTLLFENIQGLYGERKKSHLHLCIWLHCLYICIISLIGRFFPPKNPSFKITMSGRASQGNLLLNFFAIFSKSYVTFILQWVAFIFGRDKE